MSRMINEPLYQVDSTTTVGCRSQGRCDDGRVLMGRAALQEPDRFAQGACELPHNFADLQPAADAIIIPARFDGHSLDYAPSGAPFE